MYAYRHSMTADVPAPPREVFAFADDHGRLSSHMGKRSWAMGGGAMRIESDELGGKAVGSKLRLGGTVLGLRLVVEEVVVERAPPRRKVWETVGEPRLLVIGAYRMGFVIDDCGAASRLCVFIDYDLPRQWPARWLGRLLGGWYARWCTGSMARDTAKHFISSRRTT